MVREKRSSELFVTVPTFFRCPISLDLMKSPVSLSTGVTYDRSSIQTWLDSGHNTCPATMQVLHSTDLLPNLTLRRLIHLWSDSHSVSDSDSLRLGLPESESSHQASKQKILDSMNNIEKNSDNFLNSVTNIIEFANISDENRYFISKIDNFVPRIIEVFLSNVGEIEVYESIITVLDLILSVSGVKFQVHRLIFQSDRDYLTPFVSVLQKGRLKSKIESARVLQSIAFDDQSQQAITEKQQGLLYELYNLISSETDQTAIEAVLSTLTALSSTSSPAKKELVRFGIVRAAEKLLSCSDTVKPVLEKVLELLDIVSSCTEGRTAIGGDEECVSVIVRRLMKVSSPATERGIAVLWSVCHLSRDRTAEEAVMKINGVAKVLMVMQSNCSASVKQMCGDLVKVFRVNSQSCLASYETETTHIMPY